MAESTTTPKNIPEQASAGIVDVLEDRMARRGLRYPPSLQKKIRDLLAPYLIAVASAITAPITLTNESSRVEQLSTAAAEKVLTNFGEDPETVAPDAAEQSNIASSATDSDTLPEFGAVDRPAGTEREAPEVPSSDPEQEGSKNPTTPASTDPQKNTTTPEDQPSDQKTEPAANEKTDAATDDTPKPAQNPENIPGEFNDAGSPVMAPDTALDKSNTSSPNTGATPLNTGGNGEQGNGNPNARGKNDTEASSAPRPQNPQPAPNEKMQEQLKETNTAIAQLRKNLQAQKKKIKPLEAPYKQLMYTRKLLLIVTGLLLFISLILAITVFLVELAVLLIPAALWTWRTAAAIKHRLARVEKRLKPKRDHIKKIEKELKEKTVERDTLQRGLATESRHASTLTTGATAP